LGRYSRVWRDNVGSLVAYLSTSELAHSTLFSSVSSVNSTEPSSIGELASQAERAIETHSVNSVDWGSWGFEADGSGRGAISRFSFGVEFLNISSHRKSEACCSLVSIPKPIVTIHEAIYTVF
jgi:hypothetical protein